MRFKQLYEAKSPQLKTKNDIYRWFADNFVFTRDRLDRLEDILTIDDDLTVNIEACEFPFKLDTRTFKDPILPVKFGRCEAHAFIVAHSDLSSWKNFPTEYGPSTILSIQGTSLDLNKMPLTPSLTYFNCQKHSGSNFGKLVTSAPNLETIVASHMPNLTSLKGLPEHLENLSVGGEKLKFIDELPKTITKSFRLISCHELEGIGKVGYSKISKLNIVACPKIKYGLLNVLKTGLVAKIETAQADNPALVKAIELIKKHDIKTELGDIVDELHDEGLEDFTENK